MSTLQYGFDDTRDITITGGAQTLSKNNPSTTIDLTTPKTITVTKNSGEWPSFSIDYPDSVQITGQSGCSRGTYSKGKQPITPDSNTFTITMGPTPKQDPGATITVGDEDTGIG